MTVRTRGPLDHHQLPCPLRLGDKQAVTMLLASARAPAAFIVGPDSWVADYVSIRRTGPDANRSDPSVRIDLDMHGGKRRWFHPSRFSRFASALVRSVSRKRRKCVRVCVCVGSVHDENPGWNKEMRLGEKKGEESVPDTLAPELLEGKARCFADGLGWSTLDSDAQPYGEKVLGETSNLDRPMSFDCSVAVS